MNTKESERLDRRPEQGDDGRSDAGRHVHHAGVAGDEYRGARETGAGLLEREFPRRVDHGRPESARELAVIRTTERDQGIVHAPQLLGQRLPVMNRPALGGVRGARR